MMRIICFIILNAVGALPSLAGSVTDDAVRAKQDEFACELRAYTQRGIHPAYGLAKILLDNQGDHHADIAYAILTQGVGFGGINPNKVATPDEAALGKATAFLYGVKKSTESQTPIQKALSEESYPLDHVQRVLASHKSIINHFANLGARYLPEDPDFAEDEAEERAIDTQYAAKIAAIKGKANFDEQKKQYEQEKFREKGELYKKHFSEMHGSGPQLQEKHVESFEAHYSPEILGVFSRLKAFYRDETIPSVQAFIDHNVMNATLLYGVDLTPPSLSSLMRGYYFKDMYTAVQAAIKKARDNKSVCLKLANIVDGDCFGGRASEAILCASVYVLKHPQSFSPPTYENARRNLKQAHAFFRSLERMGGYVSEFYAFIAQQSSEENLAIAEDLAHLYLNPSQFPTGEDDIIYPAYMAIAELIGVMAAVLENNAVLRSRVELLKSCLLSFKASPRVPRSLASRL